MMRAALECAHRGWGECCIIGEYHIENQIVDVDVDENEDSRIKETWARENGKISRTSLSFNLIKNSCKLSTFPAVFQLFQFCP